MIIRQECQKDFEKIYQLVKKAFQTAKVSNGKEQEFVNELRSSDRYIPELALVAEENEKLIGHIMLTKTYITNEDDEFETLLVAPLSVALEYRNKGIGSKLIKKSLQLAKEKGYTSAVLVGDPNYYHRFGFKSSTEFNIKHALDIPEQFVMANELVPDAFQGISGLMHG